MSLVTRCPSCATTFKVVRDQLRISDGWVRCGRCSNVFDATLELQQAPEAGALATATRVEAPAESPPDPVPFGDPEPQPPRSSESPLPAWPTGGVVADDPWPTQSVPLPQEPMPALTQASLASSMEALDEFSAVVDQSANAQLEKALRRARIQAVTSARARRAATKPEEKADRNDAPMPMPMPMPVVSAASAFESRAEARPPLPSFAQPASTGAHTAPSRGRGAKVMIGMVLVLAALLLAVQVIRHERDAIAAQQPSLRPALELLCSHTACELSALRRIGDITIDGAAFARDRSGDGYRLNFTLRNGVAMPLAMPAVELTLLDTQERPVVRRVLMPSDFGAPPVLAARAERAASLSLVLTGSEAVALPAVAGYRVVAFYP